MIGMRVTRKTATAIRLPLFGICLIDRIEAVYGERESLSLPAPQWRLDFSLRELQRTPAVVQAHT